MSGRVVDPVSEVWNHSRSAGTERVVLLAIAKHADADGYAWPGLARLVEMANVSERATQAAIAKLLDSGELAVLRGRGRGHPSLYRVLLGQLEGAGDPAVMLEWLRSKTTPFLAALYGQVTTGKVSSASPFEGVQPASPFQEPDARKGEAERREKVKLSVEQPGAYRNELPEEDEEPPTVVAPDGARPTAELVATNGHAPVIPLRSAPAVQAVITTFDGLKAEIEATGRRSWSLTEAAKRAWDQLLDEDANLRSAQEFLVWYIAFNVGRDVREMHRRHWSMAGQKVGRHRSLALYGVDQAITRVDIDQPDERGQVGQPFWNYVEAVCKGARAEVVTGGGA